MPMRNWGGGGDLSGTFGSLLDQFQSMVETGTNRIIKKAKEDQAAEDAEAYDNWNNGLMSDEQWLAYIQNRITEAGGDPVEKQKWEETYRNHSDAIRDGQMETDYQEGRIGINDLITHYKERMTGASRNSPEYREASDRYYNLVDSRDGMFIDDQAEAIIDRIERGTGSYNELLSFYEGQLKKTRKSSPLYSQIKRQINNIRDIVDGVTGRVSSGGGGGGSRRSGGSRSGGGTRSGGSGARDADEDISSDAIAEINGYVSDLMRTGNVIVPDGPSPFASVLSERDVDATLGGLKEALIADSKYLEFFLEDYLDNPNAETLSHYLSGEVTNTPDIVLEAIHRLNETYVTRQALARSMGEIDDEATIEGHWDTAINNIIQPILTNHIFPTYDKNGKVISNRGFMEFFRYDMEKFNQNLVMASTSPDPVAAMALYRQASASFNSRVKQAQDIISSMPKGMEVEPWVNEDLDYANRLANLMQAAKDMTPEEIMEEGSILMEERPEKFSLSSSQVRRLVGEFDGGVKKGDPGWSGLAGAAAARAGLQATRDTRDGLLTDVEQYIWVSLPGSSTPVAVKESEASRFLGVDGDFRDYAFPSIERVTDVGAGRGESRVDLVWRWMQPVAPITHWGRKDSRNGRVRWMTAAEWDEIGNDPKALGEGGWEQLPIPETTGWLQTIGADGRTWYIDPKGTGAYVKMPFNGGISAGAFAPMDFVNSNGEFVLNEDTDKPGLFAVVGPRVSQKEAQRLLESTWESGEIDATNYFVRDPASGRLVRNPNIEDGDLDGMFYSEADKMNDKIRNEYERWRNPDLRAAYARHYGSEPQRINEMRTQEKKRAIVLERMQAKDANNLQIRRALDSADAMVSDSDAVSVGARMANIRMGGFDSSLEQRTARLRARKPVETTEIRQYTPPVRLPTMIDEREPVLSSVVPPPRRAEPTRDLPSRPSAPVTRPPAPKKKAPTGARQRVL